MEERESGVHTGLTRRLPLYMDPYEFIDSSYRYRHKFARRIVPRRSCQSHRLTGGVDKLAANGEKFGVSCYADPITSVTAAGDAGKFDTTAITDASANNREFSYDVARVP